MVQKQIMKKWNFNYFHKDFSTVKAGFKSVPYFEFSALFLTQLVQKKSNKFKTNRGGTDLKPGFTVLFTYLLSSYDYQTQSQVTRSTMIPQKIGTRCCMIRVVVLQWAQGARAQGPRLLIRFNINSLESKKSNIMQ